MVDEGKITVGKKKKLGEGYPGSSVIAFYFHLIHKYKQKTDLEHSRKEFHKAPLLLITRDLVMVHTAFCGFAHETFQETLIS